MLEIEFDLPEYMVFSDVSFNDTSYAWTFDFTHNILFQGKYSELEIGGSVTVYPLEGITGLFLVSSYHDENGKLIDKYKLDVTDYSFRELSNANKAIIGLYVGLDNSEDIYLKYVTEQEFYLLQRIVRVMRKHKTIHQWEERRISGKEWCKKILEMRSQEQDVSLSPVTVFLQIIVFWALAIASAVLIYESSYNNQLIYAPAMTVVVLGTIMGTIFLLYENFGKQKKDLSAFLHPNERAYYILNQ